MCLMLTLDNVLFCLVGGEITALNHIFIFCSEHICEVLQVKCHVICTYCQWQLPGLCVLC